MEIEWIVNEKSPKAGEVLGLASYQIDVELEIASGPATRGIKEKPIEFRIDRGHAVIMEPPWPDASPEIGKLQLGIALNRRRRPTQTAMGSQRFLLI